MDKTSNMGQNMVKSTGDVEIDLSLMAKAVWKRIWLVVLVSVITAGVMLVGVKIFVKPTYRSGFTAYVNNKKEVDSNSLTAQDIQASRSLVHTYEEVIRSESVLESSAKSVGLNYSYSQLKKMVTTSIGDKTEIITVNVDTKNPETSYELADAVSRNSIEYTTKIIEGSSMKIVGYPEVPTDIYSPNYLRFAAMGAFLGFFISVLIICIRQLYNDKIMDEKDIAEYFSDLAILGVIPDLTDAEKSKGNHYSYYGDSD